MNKFKWFGIAEVATLVIVLGINLGIMHYLYGGSAYFLKVPATTGSFPITLDGGVAGQGYKYVGTAYNSQGGHKKVRVKTDKVDPGPFKKGSILKVTVNPRFGITNYKIVNSASAPKQVTGK